MRNVANEYDQYVKCENTNASVANYQKFLNMIAKSKYNKIIVIAHSGTLGLMQKIICNLPTFSNIRILPNEYIPNNDGKYERFVEGGNCSIIACRYINNKFELVVPMNNLHLLNMK